MPEKNGLQRAISTSYTILGSLTLFGILGYWVRQDHLGAIACLAFLALEPVTDSRGGWKEYWNRASISPK